jgi:hypothetical protein
MDMKLFKYFNFFNNKKVDSICKKYGIENYTINEDGKIDVDGNVNLSSKKLTELPLKFRYLGGGFYCYNNQLTSLEGCPILVGGGFYCYGNNLTSLKGSPQSVGGSFKCCNNKLTTLEGAPSSVGNDFSCFNNKLTTLEGVPISVGGSFDCYGNQLTSLEGCPTSVGGDFDCHKNKLTSLEGAPGSVGGDFDCHKNELTSLEGAPGSVGGVFYCSDNKLKDVYGIKEGFKLGGDFDIKDNPVEEIFKLFPKDRYDDVIEFLNEYEVIRDGKYIILQALEEVFYEMELDIPKIEFQEGVLTSRIKGYEII